MSSKKISWCCSSDKCIIVSDGLRLWKEANVKVISHLNFRSLLTAQIQYLWSCVVGWRWLMAWLKYYETRLYHRKPLLSKSCHGDGKKRSFIVVFCFIWWLCHKIIQHKETDGLKMMHFICCYNLKMSNEVLVCLAKGPQVAQK